MQREVAFFYVQKVLVDGVAFTTPFMVIYLLSYMSLGQVILLTALQFLVASLFEIPSGAIADVVGKRESLMFGALCYAISVAIFIFGKVLWHFALAFAFVGIASAFISGTHESLAFDFFEKKRRKSDAQLFFARSENYAARLTDLSYLVAGGLAAINIRLVFAAEFLKWLFVFWTARKLSKKKVKVERSVEPFKERVENSLGFLLKHKHFSVLIIISSIVYSIFLISANYYQPLMSNAGIKIAFFGLIYVLFNQARNISTRLAWQFESKVDLKNLILSSFLIKGLLLLALAIFVNPLVVVALIMVKIGTEWFRKPFFTSYITSFSPKESRATILSFANFFHSIIFVFLSVIFKMITDSYTVYHAVFVSGFLSLFFFLLFKTETLVLKNQRRTSVKS